MTESPRPTFIKICGITRLGDARAAVGAGANAVGFIFARSPRRVSPARAAAIIVHLHPAVGRIGVFVDSPIERIVEVVEKAGLDGVQLQGGETPEFVDRLRALRPSLTVYKVIRPRAAGDMGAAEEYSVDAVLFDPRDPRQPAEAARPIPLDWLERSKVARMVVAGGLSPHNVGPLVSTLRPWGVDVSGGVESAPGKKDPDLIRAFVRAVREAELSR